MTLSCPACRSRRLYRKHRKGALARLSTLVFRARPFTCADCGWHGTRPIATLPASPERPSPDVTDLPELDVPRRHRIHVCPNCGFDLRQARRAAASELPERAEETVAEPAPEFEFGDDADERPEAIALTPESKAVHGHQEVLRAEYQRAAEQRRALWFMAALIVVVLMAAMSFNTCRSVPRPEPEFPSDPW